MILINLTIVTDIPDEPNGSSVNLTDIPDESNGSSVNLSVLLYS
jgi:hypothetical protein